VSVWIQSCEAGHSSAGGGDDLVDLAAVEVLYRLRLPSTKNGSELVIEPVDVDAFAI
jgi:hypothetical protein